MENGSKGKLLQWKKIQPFTLLTELKILVNMFTELFTEFLLKTEGDWLWQIL